MSYAQKSQINAMNELIFSHKLHIVYAKYLAHLYWYSLCIHIRMFWFSNLPHCVLLGRVPYQNWERKEERELTSWIRRAVHWWKQYLRLFTFELSPGFCFNTEEGLTYGSQSSRVEQALRYMIRPCEAWDKTYLSWVLIYSDSSRWCIYPENLIIKLLWEG